MTLLVGVLCDGGVVLGADSGVTYGALGQSHIMVPTSKVEVVDGSALIAVSGPVGLGQSLTADFASNLSGMRGPPHAVMKQIQALFWAQMKPLYQAAAVAKDAIGPVLANQNALSSTLLAMPVNREPRLFTFDQQGAGEEITAKVPVVSAGSGQHNADMFLAFLRGVYWSDGHTPSLDEGVFIALWALQQCIQVSPAHLQGPERIFTLRMEGTRGVARQVPDEELQEHYEAIAGAKNALVQARQEITAPAPPDPGDSAATTDDPTADA